MKAWPSARSEAWPICTQSAGLRSLRGGPLCPLPAGAPVGLSGAVTPTGEPQEANCWTLSVQSAGRCGGWWGPQYPWKERSSSCCSHQDALSATLRVTWGLPNKSGTVPRVRAKDAPAPWSDPAAPAFCCQAWVPRGTLGLFVARSGIGPDPPYSASRWYFTCLFLFVNQGHTLSCHRSLHVASQPLSPDVRSPTYACCGIPLHGSENKLRTLSPGETGAREGGVWEEGERERLRGMSTQRPASLSPDRLLGVCW